MGVEKISVVLETNTNGTLDRDLQKSEKLRKSLEGVSNAANNIGGTRGSRRAAARARPAGMTDEDYDTAKGIVGTGAGGRDFAKQSQGLGGLVRLYATYAANVFAVSAAFRALEESMNTQNMVRGLDQLGAASGIALGGLAKRFADASGGAISFRESMESTAKAMSSGMSQKQFLALGEVAKKASQTLGIGMTDAVSRLTRGITKLEPELLDELGLFTKVGKATEDYARKVGKSVDSLTDFEKRQAFANAVLKEGMDKFGQIEVDTNPYDKLLASLKNTAQEILSMANTVLAPVAKLFAENTGLITAAIALMSVKLLKQALPALSSWRSGLKEAAEDAAKRAADINTSFGEAFVERQAAKFKIPDLEKDLNRLKQEGDALRAQFQKDQAYKRPKQSATMKAIDEERAFTSKDIARAEKEIATYSDKADAASKKHAATQRLMIDNAKEQLKLTKDLADAHERVVTASSEESKFLSGEWQREKISKDARERAAGLGLLSKLGGDIEQKGFLSGMGGFYKDTFANKDIGNLSKLKVAITGTFAGIATGAGILASSLSSAFSYLELIGATLGILQLIFGKNSKEVDTFNSSITTLNETVKTAEDVNKKYMGTLSIDSINARANAFTGLSEAIADSTQSLSKADEMASWIDRFMDNVKVIWGGNLRAQFSKGLADSISAAIKAVPEGRMRVELEDKLKRATGSAKLNRASLLDAFGGLSNDALIEMGKTVEATVSPIKEALKDSQAITQDLKDTSKATTEAYLNLKNSVSDKSPVTVFLQNSLKEAEAFKKALQDVDKAQAAFKSLASGDVKPEFLTKEVALAMMPLAEEASKLTKQSEQYASSLSIARDRLSEIDKEAESLSSAGWGEGTGIFSEVERNQVLSTISKAESGMDRIDTKIRDLAKQAEELISKSIVNQIGLAVEQTKLKLAQIAIQSEQSALAKIPVKTQLSIEYDAQLQRDAIAVEKLMYKSQENLVRSIDLLAIQVQRDADLREIAYIKSQGSLTSQQIEKVSQLESNVRMADKATAAYGSLDLKTLQTLAAESPAIRPLLSSVQGIIAVNAQFAAKLANVDLTESINKVNEKFDRQVEASQDIIKDLNIKLEALTGLEGETFRNQRAELEDLIRKETKRQADEIQKNRETEITKAVAPYLKRPGGQEVVAATLGRIEQRKLVQTGISIAGTAVSSEVTNRANEIKSLQERNEALRIGRDINEQNRKLEENRAKSANTYAREEIAFKQQMYSIDGETARQQQYSLDIYDAQIERTAALRQAESQRATAKEAYDVALKQAGGEENELLKAQRQLYENTYTTAKKGAEDTYAAQLKLLELRNSMTDREKAYASAFTQAFKSMEDAIVNFTKTGKLSFSNMINSFIEGLLRYEIQQQQIALFSSMGGAGGMAKWLSSALGFAGASTIGSPVSGSSTSFTADYSFGTPKLRTDAKGDAYSTYGIEAFAKGGMFTNSIVNSPTLFKFAHGIGLMGEAGPEAIMPLKRDSQGNLGVRAGGSQGDVSVVVNNYGNEKATTKETVDSRGNRKIEVVIGDIVAGELNRPGSTTQQAMTASYGAAPMVARR